MKKYQSFKKWSGKKDVESEGNLSPSGNWGLKVVTPKWE